MTTILLFVTVIIAALVQSTSGFGFGIVFMAIVPLFLPYSTSTVLSVFTCLFLQITIIIKLWKHIQWRMVIIPAILAIIASNIGVKLMIDLPERVMALVLGIFLWLLAIYMIFIAPKVHLKKNIWTEVGAGALSGFMTGMFAIGGPPMVAYYDAVFDDKLQYQGTIQTYFFINSLGTVFANVMAGNLNRNMIPSMVVSVVAVLIGTFIGVKILDKISMTTVRRLAYIVMLVAGTYQLCKGIFFA